MLDLTGPICIKFIPYPQLLPVCSAPDQGRLPAVRQGAGATLFAAGDRSLRIANPFAPGPHVQPGRRKTGQLCRERQVTGSHSGPAHGDPGTRLPRSENSSPEFSELCGLTPGTVGIQAVGKRKIHCPRDVSRDCIDWLPQALKPRGITCIDQARRHVTHQRLPKIFRVNHAAVVRVCKELPASNLRRVG